MFTSPESLHQGSHAAGLQFHKNDVEMSKFDAIMKHLPVCFASLWCAMAGASQASSIPLSW